MLRPDALWLHNPFRSVLRKNCQTVTVNNWEPPTVRLPDETLESVFYLYPSQTAAEEGAQAGGCGFFILVPFEREGIERNHLYMVTNRHVIDGGSLTARINIETNKFITYDTDDRAWFRHPSGDDLAIILVDFPIVFSCKGTSLSENYDLPSVLQENDIGIGDDIFTVGRFVNHDGKQRNNPVVRFGNIAQMPLEPIRQRDGHLQDSFLVECKSVAGYSGSPVFVYIAPFAPRAGTTKVTSRSFGPWLLGVNWGHLNEWKPVCDASGRPFSNPAMQVGLNSGMMGVVPAWKLIEMLKDKKVIEKRRSEEIRVLGNDPPISSSDVATPPPKAEVEGVNPHHREDFTSLLNAAATRKSPAGQT